MTEVIQYKGESYMIKTVEQINPGLPDWLQTKEQQREFLEVLEPFKEERLEDPFQAHYYDLDIKEVEKYLFGVFIPYLISHGYDLRKVRVREDRLEGYMKDGKYLPDFIQDFDNQKAFFRLIHAQPGGDLISWQKAHVYTVDLFLWNAMRLHGCKFQRTLRGFKGKSADGELFVFQYS